MYAAIITEPGKIEIRDIPIPKPSEGELLVKIKAALTCGTDLKAFLRGHPMIPMPGRFGHEFSGTIAAVGKNVAEFKDGDEIMSVHSAPCLKCRYCRKKLFNLCENIMETKVLGAFAEYILLPSHIVSQNVFHKPADISFEEAAFLEPLSCVVHGMQELNINKDDRVLITGAGPIGLLHLILLKLKGAKVLVTGLEQKRLELAKELGADETALPSDAEYTLEKFTNGMGADFVFECSGQLEVWEDSINDIRRGGTVVLFGGCKQGTTVAYDTYRLHYDEITLKGVFHFMPADVRTAYKFLRDTLKPAPLISGRYSLKDINTVFEKLRCGDGIKYAIIP